MYKKLLTEALKKISLAREMYAAKWSEYFDVDWAMEQFAHATDILEELRELED